jgi:EAL and modified HD-GYP domain-containing signal transduction protein
MGDTPAAADTAAAGETAAHAWVGRQPIFDRDLEVRGYELLYRNSAVNQATFTNPSQAASETIVNAFLEIGIDRLVGATRAWLNLTRGVFLSDACRALPKDQVVLEVLESVAVDDQLLAKLRELRSDGYRIALDDFVYRPELEPLVRIAHVIKLDILGRGPDDIEEAVARLRPMSVELLAEKVETAVELDFCHKLGFDFFQGYFLSRPHIVKRRSMAGSRLAVLRLLAKLQDPDAKLSELEAAIASDVGLSYRLLRYLNSARFANRRKIDSIRQAIVLLGLGQVRGWVSLLALAGLDDKPRELMVTAMVRARMCELLAEAARVPRPDTHFAAGMFSLLDALMECPMQEVLAELPLSDEINQALLEGKGALGESLASVLAYERGAWDDVDCPGLEEAAIREAYLRAIEWADGLASTLG